MHRKDVFVAKGTSGSSGGSDTPLVDNDGQDKHNGNATNGRCAIKNPANQVDVSSNDGADSDGEKTLLEAMLNHQEEFDNNFDDMGNAVATMTIRQFMQKRKSTKKQRKIALQKKK